MVFGFRIRIPTLVSWDEPVLFSDIKRANHADLSWRVRIIGSCAVVALAYLNWFFRHDDPDFEFTLGMSMVLAGIVAGHFFFIPWVLRGSRCFSWVDPFGIHWSRGLRCGGVQFRDASDFTWREDSDIFILSVTRKDGGEPFEIAVPDSTTRNRVSSILMTKGIRDAQGAQPDAAATGAIWEIAERNFAQQKAEGFGRT